MTNHIQITHNKQWHQNKFIKYQDQETGQSTSCNHLYGTAFLIEERE
jgi:hypothetical protein